MAAAIGLAVLSTVAANQTKSLVAQGQGLVDALSGGYRLALLIATASVLVGLAVAPILLRSPESRKDERERGAENLQHPEAQEHLIL